MKKRISKLTDDDWRIISTALEVYEEDISDTLGNRYELSPRSREHLKVMRGRVRDAYTRVRRVIHAR